MSSEEPKRPTTAGDGKPDDTVSPEPGQNILASDEASNSGEESGPASSPPPLLPLGVDAPATAMQDASELAQAASKSKRDPLGGPPEIDGYQIVRKLGQGGMGTVYLAVDERLNREVAIKIVSGAIHEKVAVRQRFQSEIHALAALQHANIARLFTAGEYQGVPYFVMEFIRGPNLEEFAREPMKPQDIASVVSQLCEAIEYCHERGVLHRDLKPSNVLLHRKEAKAHESSFVRVFGQSTRRDIGGTRADSDSQGSVADPDITANVHGDLTAADPNAEPISAPQKTSAGDYRVLSVTAFVPKVADFGLAKAIGSDSSQTRTGEVLGTPGYMSPEQAKGDVKSLGPACDVYALGAILYRLLTGRAPFVAAEPLQAVMQVIHQDPVRPRTLIPNVSSDLETICLKCLEKSAGKRYASASALRDDLQRFLSGVPISAKPASSWERGWKWAKRNPTWTVSAVAALAILCLAITGLAWHSRVLSNELDKTRRLADNGTELSKWLINEHLAELNTIPGNTQARFDLVQRVQAYLDASLRDMPPDSEYTKQLAFSYARLASVSGGEDQNNVGNPQNAYENYIRSLELYDQALAQGEARDVILTLKARTLLSLAEVALELQRPEESQQFWHAADEALTEVGTKTWERQFLRILWHEYHIERLMAENNYESAQERLMLVQKLLDAAGSEADPAEVDNQQIWIASNTARCLEFGGDLDGAIAKFAQAVKLAESGVVSDPNNALAVRRLSGLLVQYADVLFANKEAEKALEYYQQSLEMIQKLVAKDPISVDLALNLAVKYSRVSLANRYLQRMELALQATSEAIAVYERLLQRDAEGRSIQLGLVINLLSKADICIADGRLDEAEPILDRHRTLCLQYLEKEPKSVAFLNQMAEHSYQRAVLSIMRWFELDVIPQPVREDPQYLEIAAAFKESLEMFETIEQNHGLDYHQSQFREQVIQMRQVFEESIDQQSSLPADMEGIDEGPF